MRIARLIRSHDWLTRACNRLGEHEESIAGSSQYICERLAAVLLEKLPERTSTRIIDLLPDPPQWMRSKLSPEGNPSISYSDLIECAMDAIALESRGQIGDERHLESIARRVVDVFLSSVMDELPEDARDELTHQLGNEPFTPSPLNEPDLKKAS